MKIKSEEEHLKKYWHGPANHAVRYYFYTQRGLALVNEFRYIFMVIFGVYITLKLNNPLWLLAMFLVSMPILILLGWLSVHRMAKVIDWLNVKFSTHWQMYSYELQEKQNLLIRNLIKRTSLILRILKETKGK